MKYYATVSRQNGDEPDEEIRSLIDFIIGKDGNFKKIAPRNKHEAAVSAKWAIEVVNKFYPAVFLIRIDWEEESE